MFTPSFEDGPFPGTSIPIMVLLFTALPLAYYVFYRTYSDPLSPIPGPLICRLTPLWSWYHSFIGDESRQIHALHEKYGPVVRIGPHEVIFAEGEALAPIYSEKGGFLKAPAYANFDSEGHKTIFSDLDPVHRAQRSKAVMPLFSTAALRSRSHVLESCIDQFIQRLRREIAKARETAEKTGGKAGPVDVLNLSRSFALDAVSSYLFGKSYKGCSEDTASTPLSASAYVDDIVSIGRFFFLPPYLFVPVFALYQKLFPPTEEEKLSAERVSNFTKPLIKLPTCTSPLRPKEEEREKEEEGGFQSYQTRLLTTARISPEETEIQMKDVIFAGTDTTGMNLSMIIWNLCKHPDIYAKLRQEVSEAAAATTTTSSSSSPSSPEEQNLPYLEAIVKETLRTSMANPTRFPRIVPPQGWTYTSSPSSSSSSSPTSKTYFLPPGTQVSLQPWTLHSNPIIFPDPQDFNPQRWLSSPTKEKMSRDWIPFGLGPRQCIARNLAMRELVLATKALAVSGVLEGARVVGEKVEVVEWFNARVKGGKVEVLWE